jgi:hypothetical protein
LGVETEPAGPKQDASQKNSRYSVVASGQFGKRNPSDYAAQRDQNTTKQAILTADVEPFLQNRPVLPALREVSSQSVIRPAQFNQLLLCFAQVALDTLEARSEKRETCNAPHASEVHQLADGIREGVFTERRFRNNAD